MKVLNRFLAVVMFVIFFSCDSDDGGGSSSGNSYNYKGIKRNIQQAFFEYKEVIVNTEDVFLLFSGENDGDFITVKFGAVDITGLNGTYTFSERFSPFFNSEVHYGGGYITDYDDGFEDYRTFISGTITINSASENYIDMEFSFETENGFVTGTYKGAVTEAQIE